MVIEKIFEHARIRPGKVAIYDGGRKISYAEFAFWIAHVHAFLGRQDLRAGCTAVLSADRFLDCWIFGIALRGLGVNTVAPESLDRLEHLQIPDIDCVIATVSNSPREIAATGSSYRLIQLPLDQSYLPQFRGDVPDLPAIYKPGGGHTVLTSGTTGSRKKVPIGAAGEAHWVRHRAEIFGISESSVVNVSRLGLWTSFGYKMSICTWSVGGTVVIHQGLNVHRSLLIEGVTHSFFTPSILSAVLSAPRDEIRRHDSMRVLVAAGPLSLPLAQQTASLLTPHIFTFVASSEAGVWSLTRIERAEDLRSHCILPSVELEIVDSSDKRLPKGEVGAVRIRTPESVTGYLDEEEASRRVFRNGFFYPGDLGLIEPDGRLVLRGRVNNVINVLGTKFAAEPIEEALAERLGAEGVCIFSAQNGSAGEEVHVVIQSRHPIAAEQLASCLKAELPRYPHAKVHFVAALPRNAMGKVDRAAINRQLLGSDTTPATLP
jgi:non-ribosomal peptide synthetase component E (peptide arylation enzyme)